MRRVNNKKPSVKKVFLRYLECVQLINVYTQDMNKTAFRKDIKTVQAVQFNINLISQATSVLKMSYRKENKDIKWNYIVEFRNDLIHEYYNTGKNLTWDFVKEYLPKLEKKCIDYLFEVNHFKKEDFEKRGLDRKYLPSLDEKLRSLEIESSKNKDVTSRIDKDVNNTKNIEEDMEMEI